MNRFYVALAVLALVLAVGLPVAGWLYEAFDARTAFYLDAPGRRPHGPHNHVMGYAPPTPLQRTLPATAGL